MRYSSIPYPKRLQRYGMRIRPSESPLVFSTRFRHLPWTSIRVTRLGCRWSLTRQKYSPESTERTGAMWRLKLVEERYIRSGALRITVPSWLYETSLDAVLFLDPPLPLPKPLYI